jgi:hypothetical protein
LLREATDSFSKSSTLGFRDALLSGATSNPSVPDLKVWKPGYSAKSARIAASTNALPEFQGWSSLSHTIATSESRFSLNPKAASLWADFSKAIEKN